MQLDIQKVNNNNIGRKAANFHKSVRIPAYDTTTTRPPKNMKNSRNIFVACENNEAADSKSKKTA